MSNTMVILSKHSTFTLPNKLLALLNEYEFIFNPSYSECNGGRYLAIRLCKNKKSTSNEVDLMYRFLNQKSLVSVF